MPRQESPLVRSRRRLCPLFNQVSILQRSVDSLPPTRGRPSLPPNPTRPLFWALRSQVVRKMVRSMKLTSRLAAPCVRARTETLVTTRKSTTSRSQAQTRTALLTSRPTCVARARRSTTLSSTTLKATTRTAWPSRTSRLVPATGRQPSQRRHAMADEMLRRGQGAFLQEELKVESSSWDNDVVKKTSKDPAERRAGRRRTPLREAFKAAAARSSFLERRAVSTRVQAKYDRQVEMFLAFVRENSLSTETGLSIDAALTQYMGSRFFGSANPEMGEKLLAGLLHRYPVCNKTGGKKLPRAWKSLKGRRRLCPSRSRRPPPW